MPAKPEPRAWFNANARSLMLTDQDVLKLLRQTRDDINRQLRALEQKNTMSAALRREQMLLSKRIIITEQAKLWRSLGDVVRARRLEAAARMVKLTGALDRYLLTSVASLPGGADIVTAIIRAEEARAVSAMDRLMARISGDSYIPLSERVYRSETTISGTINRRVNSAIARGLSAREFASEMSDYINPYTEGGIRYAAMRLARTEINNAAHAVAIQSVQDHPWVDSMRWHLSGSHPKVDECNSLAAGGVNGDGIYPKGSVPSKPHPHCLCYVTPETPSDDEFLNRLLGGQYNSYLERYSPGISGRLASLVG